MEYSRLTELYVNLEATSKRLEKTKLLADFLKDCTPKEVDKILLLAQGIVFARFDERKTHDIEMYLKECAKSIDGRYVSGGHDYIDANLILDDDTRVYVKSHDGRLKIKFNKEDNSVASYERVKDMCEGIKQLLAKN